MILVNLLLLLVCTPLDTNAETCPPEGCNVSPIKMEYRKFGPSGLFVSALSYGNMFSFEQSGVEGSLEIVKYLVDNGVNFFDTAEGYGQGEAEKIFGEVLRLGMEKKYWERSDLVISTKIYFGKRFEDLTQLPNKVGLSRKHLIEGTNRSLSRLGLSYVDVLFCHRPDSDTPTEEIVRTMDWLINQGKTFYWGTSEWSAEEIRRAHAIADRLGLIHPIVEQPEYSLLMRDRFESEYAPLYEDPGMATTVWGTLASGVLSGKYLDGIPEDSRVGLIPQLMQRVIDRRGGFEYLGNVVRQLKVVADELGCTLPQLSMAWVLKNDKVTTILMGGRMKYLKENLETLNFVSKLTPEVLERLETIVDNKPEAPIPYKNFPGMKPLNKQ